MKYSAITSAFFAAVAVAQPHGHLHHLRHHKEQHDKRELVTAVEWVTETQYVTKLVDSTTTVWVTPGAETTSDAAKFIESKKKTTTTTSTTTTSTSSSTTSTSVYVPPTTSTTLATSTTSTSVYVAPTTTSSSTSVYVAQEESTSTSVYVAPTTTSVYVAPTTTSVYVAPTTTAEEAAASSTAASESDTSSSSSTSSGGGSGDMTYYTIGRGSCGEVDTGKDNSVSIVALSTGRMAAGANGANPNNNKLCGNTITITGNGKTTTAIIQDTCEGCEYDDIDVSEKVFIEIFGSLDSGRSTVSWTFN